MVYLLSPNLAAILVCWSQSNISGIEYWKWNVCTYIITYNDFMSQENMSRLEINHGVLRRDHEVLKAERNC